MPHFSRSTGLVFLIALAGSSASIARAEHPCYRHLASQTGFKSCPEVDRFRNDPATNLARKQPSYGSIFHSLKTLGDTEIGFGCEDRQATKQDAIQRLDLGDQVGPKIDHFADVLVSQWNLLEPTPKKDDFKVGLALEAERLADRLEEIRIGDLDEIEEWLRRNTSQTMTMGEVEAAVRAAETQMSIAVSRKIFMKNTIRHAYEDTVVGDALPFKDTLRGARPLSGQSPDEARFELLLARARTRDEGQAFLDGLTPFHARMVLLFHVRNQIGRGPNSERQADAFVKRLRLRFSTEDQEPEDEDEVFQAAPVRFSTSIFHDGFAHGTREYPRQQVLERLPRARCNPGSGTPCNPGVSSSYVTSFPIDEKKYNVWDFLTEKEFVASLLSDDSDFFSGPFGKTFERRLLCTEKDLRVGDIVVTDGELKIFLGFQEGSDGLEPIVIEAVGGDHRTVRRAKWQIYPPGSECKTSIFTAEESRLFYVLDFRGLPEKLPRVDRGDLNL